MRYPVPLLEGRLLRRYKRFLADIELPGGEVVISHCPNPGSMKTCAPDGAPVWLSRSDDPRRKLAYTWEIVEAFGSMVCVHTGRANDLVAEALEAGALAELDGYDRVRREVRCSDRSRIDFVLEREGGEACYVEVKNVTLSAGGGVSAFPDAVTKRGTKHLEELMTLAAAGHRAVLLFCASRHDTERVRPAGDIDPVYAETLRRAARSGVEVLAYRCDVSPTEVVVRQRVPVDLAD